ncbi:MAG: hypothetical protein NZ693_09840 [Thermoflexales bacterium]|nr:hypothetical protein [Thermoflexales bacterium]
MNAAVLRRAFSALAEQRVWLVANASKAPCNRQGAPLEGWVSKGATLEQALGFIDGSRVVGVGLNLSLARGLLVIDLDDVLTEDGRLESGFAVHWLHRRPTYAEVSRSRRGLHIVYTLPPDAAPLSVRAREIEAYAHTPRFMLLTGELHPYGTLLLADAPDELLTELRQHRPEPQPKTSAATAQRGAGEAFSFTDFVRSAPAGERNNRLFWAACRLAERGLALADAETLLLPAALAAGLSEREIRASIASAFKQPSRARDATTFREGVRPDLPSAADVLNRWRSR